MAVETTSSHTSTILYIPNILLQPDVRKNSRLGSREAQSEQSQLFSALFRFSNITAELFILVEKF